MNAQSRAVLPQSKQQKQSLKDQIQSYIDQLNSNIQEESRLISQNSPLNKQIESMVQKVQTLNLRLGLIDKCQQFSLHRLNHLEEIFKYYCTHIFKIGKHMTFDRLQYEKQHLNSERFFLFLKDFGLTVMQLDGKPKQIITKQTIMTIFKKTSSTSRDLNFEQFIKCLQKIGLVYYDQKFNYWNKLEEQKLEKIKRKKEIQKRKIKRMKINGQKVDQKMQQEVERLEQQEKQLNIRGSNEQNNEEAEQNNEELQNGQNSAQKQQNVHKNNSQQQLPEENNENDDLIKQMMENKDLEDPNEEINQITKQNKLQTEDLEKRKKNQKSYEQKLLTLTNNQKIQYFYQLIGVDSVKQYKNKLTILSMIAFKGKKDSSSTVQGNKQNKTISMDDSATNNQMEKSKSVEDQERFHKLKEKMNEKKQKIKNQPIPKPKQQKQSETAKQRREMKAQREMKVAEKLKEKQMENDAVKQKAKDQKKGTDKPVSKNQQNSVPVSKMNFNQKEVHWGMLQKMSFDQLKLRQFNPTRLYHQDDDDYIFMQEYGYSKAPNRTSRIQARQRQSLSIVENVRKRADQVEKSERKQQTKMNNKMNQGGRGSVKGKF